MNLRYRPPTRKAAGDPDAPLAPEKGVLVPYHLRLPRLRIPAAGTIHRYEKSSAFGDSVGLDTDDALSALNAGVERMEIQSVPGNICMVVGTVEAYSEIQSGMHDFLKLRKSLDVREIIVCNDVIYITNVE